MRVKNSNRIKDLRAKQFEHRAVEGMVTSRTIQIKHREKKKSSPVKVSNTITESNSPKN